MAFDPRKKDRKLPKIGLPSNSEGNNGDIEMYLTPQGLGMFGKFNNEWYPFAIAQEKGLINKDIRSTLEITSSLTIKNKGLLKLFNSANKYYSSFEQSNFSTEDVNYILPVSGYSEASSFLSLGASNRMRWRSFSEVREDLGITSAEILDWTTDQGDSNIHASNFNDILTTTLEVRAGLTTDGAILNLATEEPTVVANDVLGRINFYAPLDTGLDSDLVGASIVAIAEDTFSDTVNSTSLQFQTGTSETAATRMTIDEDGKVGIGTTGPSVPLHVDSGISDTVAIFKSSDDRARIQIQDDDTTNHIVSNNSNLSLGANNTKHAGNLNIDSSGNVGIGTTSPSTSLHIHKVITDNADNSLMTIQGDRDTGDLGTEKVLIDFTMTDSNANNYPQVKIGAAVGQNSDANTQGKEGSGAFVVYTSAGTSDVDGEDNTAERMRVDYQGNVGIGTTSPNAEFHLHSTSGAAKLWITGEGGNPSNAGKLRFSEQEDGNNYFQFSHDGSANTLSVDSNNQDDMTVWDRSNNRVTHAAQNRFYRAYPQVKFSDDSGTDSVEVGLSGNSFFHKGSDDDVNFLFRNSNNDDILFIDSGLKAVGINDTSLGSFNFKIGDNGRMNMPVRGLEFENNHGYFNQLGNQGLAWVLTSTQNDLIRHETPLTLEYWNGSAWVDGISGTTSENSPTTNLTGLKNILDGTKSNYWLLDDTWRKFRFVIERESTWAEDQMLALDVGWSSISFSSGSSAGGAMIPTVQVEMLDGAYDADDDNNNDWNASGQEPYTTDWHSTGIATVEGVYYYYRSTGVHDNDTHVRITVEFPAWDASAGGSARMRVNNIHLFTSYVNDRNTEVWTTNWDRDSIGYGHVDIPSSHEYQINSTKVLDATSLGSAVVGSSLTSVGTLTGLTSSGVVNINSSSGSMLNITNTGDTAIATIESEGAGSSGRSLVKFKTNGGDWEVGARNSDGNPDNSFYIYENDDAAYRFVIEDGGNVGIGTTNPASLLHIEEGDIRIDTAENGTQALRFSDRNGTEGQLQYNSQYLKLRMLTDAADGTDTKRLTVLGGQDATAVGIGTDDPTTTLDVEGTVSYKHTAFSTLGPTDDLDVSDTTIIECNTVSNSITIGGFTGGVQGQVIHIVKTSSSNNLSLEHAEGTGNQDIYLTTGANERIVGYGGWTLYCNGSHWFSLSNPTGGADA